MYFRINEVSTIRATGNTYVHVDFWRRKSHFDAGDPPFLTNDFHMQLQPTGAKIVERDDGWLKLAGGDYISPAQFEARIDAGAELALETEPVTHDLRAQILTNIDNYWAAAQLGELSGDHTSDSRKQLYWRNRPVPQQPTPAIVRDNSDPKGVLARREVKDLRGAKIER